jgi:hypothetical protein
MTNDPMPPESPDLPPEEAGEPPSVSIVEDADDNGVIRATADALIAVAIGLPVAAVAGDTLSVTDDITTTQILLTPEDIAAGVVNTGFSSPGEGNTLVITATHINALGVVSAPGMDAAVVDSGAADMTPVVTILEEVSADGIMRMADLGARIPVQVELPGNAVCGAIITVTDGSSITEITLEAADLAIGFVSTTVARPGYQSVAVSDTTTGTATDTTSANPVFTVSATLTDPRGKRSAAGCDTVQLA